MRLIAFIAKAGICSRRKAGIYIKDGKVGLCGKIVREPWYIVKDSDWISLDGKQLSIEKKVYVVVNKPRGVTATTEDRFAVKKVTELAPAKYGRLYPVGRLDKGSRGLLILTNDGDLCYKLTHPKFEVEKEYALTVSGEVDSQKLNRIKAGVEDEGDILKVKSCSIVNSKKDKTELSVTVQEGKKRHLRRLFKSVGLEVLDLKRVRIGGLELGNLREGSFRTLDKDDIYRLALASADREARCKDRKR